MSSEQVVVENRGFDSADNESLTRIADMTVADRFQRSHDGLVEHFTGAEVVEIAAIVINMNVWTRLKLAEGATPAPA